MICFSFLFGFIQLGSFRLFVSLAETRFVKVIFSR